ncbi:MAG: hypothetical protein LBC70_07030 [Chitinispirillales bacterium]|nr:hypothetical protein [Chitinispirillales bacterium]
MNNLRETVQDFSDEKLLNIYHTMRDEYTEEAFKIFEEEIARRNLDTTVNANERTEMAIAAAAAAVASLSRDDFHPLECYFSKSDVLIANSILNDSKIPYFIKKQEDAEKYDIYVYRDEEPPRSRVGELLTPAPFIEDQKVMSALGQALSLIHEHFEPGEDGQYFLRRTDALGRLKSFNINDMKFSERAAREVLDVEFSAQEKKELAKLAELLIDEADSVEERGRVVFFYDSLEAVIEKLRGKGGFTRVDFLVIVELCQVYCDDPRYDAALNQTASSILDFFME